MRFLKRTLSSIPFLLFVLALSFVVALCWAGFRQAQLASRLIRLHVVANSDNEHDQALKLQVRDAVLAECNALLQEQSNAHKACDILQAHLTDLAQTGYAVTQQQRSACSVRVRMVYEQFPRTDYTDFSLPSGRYQALRIELGEAQGHNWWCVVYPALCLSPVTEQSESAIAHGLTQEDLSLVAHKKRPYQIRFRCLEWLQELRSSIERAAVTTNSSTP